MNKETKDKVYGEGRKLEDGGEDKHEDEESREDEKEKSKTNNQKHLLVTNEEASKKKRKTDDPKNLIRTIAAAHQGALEPFLVSTQPRGISQTQSQSQTTSSSASESTRQANHQTSLSTMAPDTNQKVSDAKEGLLLL